MTIRTLCPRRIPSLIWAALLVAMVCGMAFPGFAAQADSGLLAPTPPMGWNDWAHYECGFTAQTILDNAKALVKTGLAARGYNTVTIDDCWMLKDRDASGNLQVDPVRFPQGMKPIADAVHGMGLKFGIYEDAGYETCGKFAGSGETKDGGKDHFLQDAKLFESWGVDYLKLDGCNLYAPDGKEAAYRKAYAAQSAALKQVNRPIVFSESAPAYFQATPDWYTVLTWVRDYGQLWREGTDVATYRTKDPDRSRFHSVLWNYSYNLPLGRFQKPGNWNDADFIIGGDHGMTLPETRSQIALWSMMSAPLILSSNLDELNPQSIEVLSNKAIIAVDQDAEGKTATLVRRTPQMDILFKPLADHDYAVAVLNRDENPINVDLHPSDLGFTDKCRLDTEDLWTGHRSSASTLQATIASHDTGVWKVHPASSCGTPTRTGAIVTIVDSGRGRNRDLNAYTRCLTAPASVQSCSGTPSESWTVTSSGTLQSGDRCLAVADGKPVMQACSSSADQHWEYTLQGNLVGSNQQCLSSSGDPASGTQGLSVAACGHNLPSQIWSLPN
jgi:alpha-galactosidase